MSPIAANGGRSSRNWWMCANTYGFEARDPDKTKQGTKKKVMLRAYRQRI
jgi:hypothetical protein